MAGGQLEGLRPADTLAPRVSAFSVAAIHLAGAECASALGGLLGLGPTPPGNSRVVLGICATYVPWAVPEPALEPRDFISFR
jgi:hypothetical protein